MSVSRERAAKIAQQTLTIIEEGVYVAPSGKSVDVREAIERAVVGTVSYAPEVMLPAPTPGEARTTITVENETTLQAAQRLVAEGKRPVALNFASAKHPGGGFLSGAQAQEESLARASGLYACLRENPMYAYHLERRDPMYSHYALYSPDVPVFREEEGALLETPYLCAFLTCPAVNAGVVLERNPTRRAEIRETMAERIHRVLTLMALHEHTTLILGAWGCGVFGNNPHEIAELFRESLSETFRGVFVEVVFAVWDTAPRVPIYGAFESALTE